MSGGQSAAQGGFRLRGLSGFIRTVQTKKGWGSESPRPDCAAAADGLMAEVDNVLLLAGEALLYFTALGARLRARTRIGLGAFFCTLRVMHFLETYLAGA